MIEIENLVCGHGSRPVVRVPFLRIADDEVIALIGRSGGGKSTLLATLAGAIPVLSGSIRLDGRATGQVDLAKTVARTLQAFPLLHWLTVQKNLELAARIRGVRMDSPDAVLSAFSATHIAHRYPKELSGGERARASLAQATLSRPRMLLLDEPLTGLDPVVRNEVAKSLFDFAKDKSCAVMLVTHDLADAVQFADRIIVLRCAGETSVVDFSVPTAAPDATGAALRAMRGDDAVAKTQEGT
jgi:ABC-type nitrate/sulfonate/bicarbonate transport system ATPase subunit